MCRRQFQAQNFCLTWLFSFVSCLFRPSGCVKSLAACAAQCDELLSVTIVAAAAAAAASPATSKIIMSTTLGQPGVDHMYLSVCIVPTKVSNSVILLRTRIMFNFSDSIPLLKSVKIMIYL